MKFSDNWKDSLFWDSIRAWWVFPLIRDILVPFLNFYLFLRNASWQFLRSDEIKNLGSRVTVYTGRNILLGFHLAYYSTPRASSGFSFYCDHFLLKLFLSCLFTVPWHCLVYLRAQREREQGILICTTTNVEQDHMMCKILILFFTFKYSHANWTWFIIVVSSRRGSVNFGFFWDFFSFCLNLV